MILLQHVVTIAGLDKEIPCEESQTILDACLRAGVWLPHACTHGTCGTCKSQIIEGEIDYGSASPFSLMDFEREERMALLCCATPRSDVAIEADIEIDPGVVFHRVVDQDATVEALQEVAIETRKLFVRLDAPLRFTPGQYLRLYHPRESGYRNYSIANQDNPTELIELHIRRSPGGVFTDGWIFDSMRGGERIKISGPFGRFVLRPLRPEPILLIAGGTGLAPIKAIIADILTSMPGREFHLFQGGRTLDTLYDVELFQALHESAIGFFYHPVLSEESVAGFGHGMVTDAVENSFESLSGYVAYVCGPPPMVDASYKTLMRKRLFPRDIYREDFFDESDKVRGSSVESPLLRR